MARSGHTEGIHHFRVALDLLGKVGDKPGRAAQELELCVKLGPALMMVKGPGSSEVEAIYRRAVALEAGEDSSARFKALWGLYYYSTMTAIRTLRQQALKAHVACRLEQVGADFALLIGCREDAVQATTG
jgi:hypothetical protein